MFVFSFIDSTYISGILRVKNRTFILISAYSRMAFWHRIALKSQLSATQDPSLCTRPQAHPNNQYTFVEWRSVLCLVQAFSACAAKTVEGWSGEISAWFLLELSHLRRG